MNQYNTIPGIFPAPYACYPQESRGRYHREEEHQGRSPYQRDRDRIIHATAFRRLEYKTQVFVYNEGDHYRTRLTHSLEVAQLARSICRELGANEDVAEAVALAHDMGHPPFGHAGEASLNHCMAEYGGFDHNAQTLRILTHLEQKYAAFDGLNLTWESLEGIVKHNGPLLEHKKPIHHSILAYNNQHDLMLGSWPALEAQIAAISDDIAYNNHDLEDGIRAGLFTLEEAREHIPLVEETLQAIEQDHQALSLSRVLHELKRRMIHKMVVDLVHFTRACLKHHNIETAEDIRNQNQGMVAFSEEMATHCASFKTFLMQHMYRHYKVNRMTRKVQQVVHDLFHVLFEEPQCLPPEWSNRFTSSSNKTEQAIVVSDFIAGMTDRFALEEHARLLNPTFRLIGNM